MVAITDEMLQPRWPIHSVGGFWAGLMRDWQSMPPAESVASAWNLVLALVAEGTTAEIPPVDDGDGGGDAVAAGDPGRKVAVNDELYPHGDDGRGDGVGDGRRHRHQRAGTDA